MALERVSIRPYEPADREGFLSLYQTVWDRRKDRDWFAWRFGSNPYRDGVQMVVADVGDDVVGVEPLLPFRLRAGSTTIDAYQPVDWLVHPDYRRQGVFTRMTEALLERYAGDAAVLFNFPNDSLLPGLRKHDWRVVGDVPSHYRVQNPGPLVTQQSDSAPASITALARCGAAFMRLGRLIERTTSRRPDVSVSRVAGVPAAQLAALYAEHPPERIHAPRDEAFLRWRFGNPRWRTMTYLASRAGKPVAAIVTATEQVHDVTCTYIVDIQPMGAPDRCSDALHALLPALLADHRDSDLLRAPAGPFSSVFRRFWFLADTAFPLSRVSTTSRLAVRPLAPHLREGASAAEDPWRVDGRVLTDPDDWLLMPADFDIE